VAGQARGDAWLADVRSFGEARNRCVSIGGALEQRRQQILAALPFVLRRRPGSPFAPAGILGSLLVSQRTRCHSGCQVPESFCEETRIRLK
jgi:hypothetical protein